MAHSTSLKESQSTLTCQLCDDSSKIQCKCMQCNFFLCAKCKSLHEKVKSSDQHNIIDIKDISNYDLKSSPGPDLNNIPCAVHKGQKCCLFCTTCEEVVCPICFTETHNKHELIELDKGYNISMDKIKSFHSKLEVDFKKHRIQVSKLKLLLSEQNTKYKGENEKILDHAYILKDAVDANINKLKDKLDHRWTILQNSMQDEQTKAEKDSKDLQSRKERLANIMSSGQGTDVFGALKEIKTSKSVKNKSVNTKFRSLPKFEPQSETVFENESFCGIFTEAITEKSTSKKEFEILHEYKTSSECIENLVCGDDNCLWISHFKTNLLQKVDIKNNYLDYQYVLWLHVNSMALLPSGNLILSTKESDLSIFKKENGSINKFSAAQSVTLAVHLTRDRKVVVSSREGGETFPVKGPRKLTVYSLDGKKEKSYHEYNGKRLFSYPRRIASDTDNFYVTDITDENFRGRIIAVKRSNGEFKWTYQAPRIKDYIFKPRAILMIPSDVIAIADIENSAIHILNPTGQCVKLFNIKDTGIKFPTALDINSKGNLLIGCKAETHNVAKIYEVKLNGL